MTLAALFIAQATNTELTLGHQIALLLVAMLSSRVRPASPVPASSPWPPPLPWCRRYRWPAWR